MDAGKMLSGSPELRAASAVAGLLGLSLGGTCKCSHFALTASLLDISLHSFLSICNFTEFRALYMLCNFSIIRLHPQRWRACCCLVTGLRYY